MTFRSGLYDSFEWINVARLLVFLSCDVKYQNPRVCSGPIT